MSGQSEHAGIQFIKTLFAATTEHDVFVTSLANDRDDPNESGPRHIITRDGSVIVRFMEKWDRAGRGLFFCISTLKPGSVRRDKASVSELIGLHADIDFKSIDMDPSRVLSVLDQCRHQPTVVVSSGGGYHAYWLFRESLNADADTVDRVELAMKQLCDHIGGDPAVTEIARLMRMPGTHNTKNGAWHDVTVVRENATCRYELDDLEEWLSEVSPVIRRKQKEGAVSEEQTNPFLAAAARLGFKPAIDVEKRLSAMSYQGVGENSVHQTQLQVSSSLLQRGHDLEEVVAILMDATRAAAGQYGERWNWKREERAIRNMCESWRKKNPVSQSQQARPAATGAANSAATGTDGKVVNMQEARERRSRPKQAPEHVNIPAAVIDGVIEAIRRDGHDILLTEGEVFIYGDGIWRIMTPADQQWLQTLIQEGFEALGEPGKTSALATAWKRLNEHPDLFRRDVKWCGGDVIVAQNGVLDIRSRQFTDHAPSHYARRKIGTHYDPLATCPRFLTLLESMFSNRPPQERDGFLSVIQSFAGACLAVQFLSREERKALILVGPSRTGKTELSRIIRLLVGNPVATPSVAEISERFGLSSLYDAAAWIRDDAINEGDNLDPQRFKTIVTGEPIDIERKHRPAVPGVELAVPVLLTTNALPKARDKSDAIFNRALVLEMTNVVSEDDAHSLRQALGIERGKTIGSQIFEEEGAGILNWALDGLTRLLDRGSYDIPESVRAALQRFKDDNNPVGEWARNALVRSPFSKVSRPDLLCAYHGWQREQDGDDARAFGGRAFFPRLRAAAPWSGEAQDHSGRRFITGVALTDEGLQLWDLHNQGPQLRGGSKGSSLTKSEVNKVHSEIENREQQTAETNLATSMAVDTAPRF